MELAPLVASRVFLLLEEVLRSLANNGVFTLCDYVDCDATD